MNPYHPMTFTNAAKIVYTPEQIASLESHGLLKPTLKDSDILEWLDQQGMESGLIDGRLNVISGKFYFLAESNGEVRSATPAMTVQEAIENWKLFYDRSPTQQIEELRSEAKVLLKQARELEEKMEGQN